MWATPNRLTHPARLGGSGSGSGSDFSSGSGGGQLSTSHASPPLMPGRPGSSSSRVLREARREVTVTGSTVAVTPTAATAGAAGGANVTSHSPGQGIQRRVASAPHSHVHSGPGSGAHSLSRGSLGSDRQSGSPHHGSGARGSGASGPPSYRSAGSAGSYDRNYAYGEGGGRSGRGGGGRTDSSVGGTPRSARSSSGDGGLGLGLGSAAGSQSYAPATMSALGPGGASHDAASIQNTYAYLFDPIFGGVDSSSHLQTRRRDRDKARASSRGAAMRK